MLLLGAQFFDQIGGLRSRPKKSIQSVSTSCLALNRFAAEISRRKTKHLL
jgi:hypothetical protein